MDKRKLVGIILSESHKQFYRHASRELQRELLSMNCDVCIFTTTALAGMPAKYIEGESAIYNLIEPDMFDGFIVYPDTFQMPKEQEAFLKRLKEEYHKPVYCLERPHYDFPTIAFREEEGIAMLVEHLVKEHHASRIEYISLEDEGNGVQKELEDYFLNALRRNRIFITDHSIHYGNYHVGNEILLVEEMLRQDGGLPEAIICGNTESVSGFICAFEEKGIQVPRDIMICGYQLDIDDTIGGTTCTTIFRDPTVMARNAARSLVNDILGENRYALETDMPECRLVPKSTCGCEFYALGDYSRIRREQLLSRDRSFDSPYNFMEEDIAGADSVETWLWHLDYYERYLGKECESFYLCLNEFALHRTEEYKGFTDRMVLALNHSVQRKVSMDTYFATSTLLPALYEPCDHPRVFYFASVHFMDRVFGYVAVCYGDKVCGLNRSFQQWMRRLETSLECQRQKTVFMDFNSENATRDGMTGLYNYKGYLSALQQQYRHLEGKHRFLRIVAVDINRLSSINEMFGRDEGNEALRTLAKIIGNSMNDRDACARLGNDEFLAAGIYEREPDVQSSIREMNSRLRTVNEFGGKQYTINVVYTSLSEEITDEKQIETLTNEIIAKKKNMKQGLSSEAMVEKKEINPEEREAVRTLLDENRLTYRFQPIVNAKTGSVYAYEALMRSEVNEAMSPLTILNHAEAMGRLYDIELLTFRNVAKIMLSHKNLFSERKLFVNSIPKATLKDKDYKAFILEYPGVPAHMVVEFTEQTEPNQEQLETIRKRSEQNGFRIAIDDYGTGYSNVSNLLNYMPDYVKIDRCLISGIETDSKKQYFVANIVEFARTNGFHSLAEGVETKEEMEMVIRLGVDLIQGYYTARPQKEFVEEIDKSIREEILSLNMQNGESRQKKTYLVDREQELMLMPLVTSDHYTEFIVNRRELTLVGNPRFALDALIRIPDNVTTTIYMKRVSLDSYQRHACIEVGNNCDVTLVIEGINILNRKGIRVPESSRLTIKGEGKLTIYGNGDRAYGIGGDSTQTIGRITVSMGGEINIRLDGKECVGIGGGYSNSQAGLFIEQCKNLYEVISGEKGVGIGVCNSVVPIEISDARMKIEANADRATAIGSVTADCDIKMNRVKLNYTSSGDLQVGIGCLAGKQLDLRANGMEMQMISKAKTCVGIGTRDGIANIRLLSSEINLNCEGAEVLGFGTKTKKGRGQFEKSAFTIRNASGDRLDFGYEPEDMSFLQCTIED